MSPRSRSAAAQTAALFPPLPRGQGTVGPERAARNRRDRLTGAMVAAVASHGYERVTIAELVGLAGISKRDFYESFANKEECFFAALEEVSEAAAARARVASRSAEGPRERLLAALEEVGALIVDQPGAASLVTIDSLSLGTVAVAHRERAAARFERLLGQCVAASAEQAQIPELELRGVVGGAWRVLYRCLREGRPERFGEHAAELVDWALAYRRPHGRRALPASVLALPKLARAAPTEERPEGKRPTGWSEPPGSARSRATLSQRERIVRAVARLVVQRGYGQLSVPAISAEAGVSNQTFYREFANKQEAFLAAFDEIGTWTLRLATGSGQVPDNWAEGVAAGICATLSLIAIDPLYSRLAFFELAAAGPAGLARLDLMTEQFMHFLKSDALPPEVEPVPDVIVEAIGGGIWAILQHEVVRGRAASVLDLAPAAVDFILAPFGAR